MVYSVFNKCDYMVRQPEEMTTIALNEVN